MRFARCARYRWTEVAADEEFSTFRRDTGARRRLRKLHCSAGARLIVERDALRGKTHRETVNKPAARAFFTSVFFFFFFVTGIFFYLSDFFPNPDFLVKFTRN